MKLGFGVVIGIVAAGCGLLFGQPAVAQDKVPLKIAVNRTMLFNAAIFYGIESGIFEKEGINFEVVPVAGSSNALLPALARGDVDLLATSVGPGLLNGIAQGFNLKFVVPQAVAKEGWNDGQWIMARKDLYDSGKITKVEDFKGHHVEGTVDGTIINLLMRIAIADAGLKLSDMNFTTQLKTPPDWGVALENKAVDALIAVDPFASAVVEQKLGVKLKSAGDVRPGFMVTAIAASEKLIAREDVLLRFLRGYLRASKDMVDAGPKWTPKMFDPVFSFMKVPAEQIQSAGGPPYFGTFDFPVDSVKFQMDAYAARGVLEKTDIPVAALYDDKPLKKARAQLGY